MKLLIVVTGTNHYGCGCLKTGLWLSEFTHIFHSAKQRGYEVVVANPKGGATPVDPLSLKPLLLDRLSALYWEEPAFHVLLRHARPLDEAAEELFDCVWLAGGHGAMFDFPGNAVLQRVIRRHYESGRIVAAICHGVCGLLDVRLSDGSPLLRGKRVTGYSWCEERLALRSCVVPFDLEAALKRQGADYRKAWFPMTPKVVIDGNLVTGQNPVSSKATAETVVCRLEKR